jgi:anti-sigma factor RsiW
MTKHHPLETELLDYNEGELSEEQRSAVAWHLADCSVCRLKLVRLIADDEPDDDDLLS